MPKKERDNVRRYIAFLLLAAPLVLAACSSSKTPAGPVSITVTAKSLKFDTATIEVVAGQPVKLTFQNNDSLDHDFSIMEIPMQMIATAMPMGGHDMPGVTGQPQLHMLATTGQSNTLEFTPTEPGTYEFFCTVPGHKEAGMVGQLVVKAP